MGSGENLAMGGEAQMLREQLNMACYDHAVMWDRALEKSNEAARVQVLLDEQVQVMSSCELLLKSKNDELLAMSNDCTLRKQDLMSMEESLGELHGLHTEIERMKESEKSLIGMVATELQKNLLKKEEFGKVTLTTKAEFEPWFKDVIKKAKPLDSDYSVIEEHTSSLCKTLRPFMLTTSTPQELDRKFQAIQQAFNLEKEAGGRLFEVASKLEALVKFVGQIKFVGQTGVPSCEQDDAQSAFLVNLPPVPGGPSRDGSPTKSRDGSPTKSRDRLPTKSNPSKKRLSVNPKHPQERSPVGELPLSQATANTNADSRRNSDSSPRLASEGSTPNHPNRTDAVRSKARRSMPLPPSAPLPKSRHR